LGNDRHGSQKVRRSGLAKLNTAAAPAGKPVANLFSLGYKSFARMLPSVIGRRGPDWTWSIAAIMRSARRGRPRCRASSGDRGRMTCAAGQGIIWKRFQMGASGSGGRPFWPPSRSAQAFGHAKLPVARHLETFPHVHCGRPRNWWSPG
jgi:hypothetical protein